ncbi:MAG: transglutaminase domain-containing protein [Bacteroidota bacterium]
MKYLLFSILFISIVPIFGQDYKHIDEAAQKIVHWRFQGVNSLARKLDKHAETDEEKARIIFSWITDHVKYHVKGLEKPRIAIRSTKKTLWRRKAVCSGYASLYRDLANKMGLDCELVSGYARNSYRKIGFLSHGENHAWNRVKIDSSWVLMDPTWGAGFVNFNTNRFNKTFQEHYYRADPTPFQMDHQEKDFALDWSKEAFRRAPHPGKGLYNRDFVEAFPSDGIITANQGEKMRFTLTFEEKPQSRMIRAFFLPIDTTMNKEDLPRPQSLSPKIEGNAIHLDLKIPKEGKYHILFFEKDTYQIGYRLHSINPYAGM